MSEHQRKKKPTKRNNSTSHGKESQLSSKRLKDTSKTFIQLKKAEQIIQEFHSSFAGFLPPNIDVHFQPDELEIRLPDCPWDDHRRLEMHSLRYVLFDSLSKHVFPILSLSRHYFNTLEAIHIANLCFNPYKTKDLEFLQELFNCSALLPYLKFFKLSISGRVEIHDFEGWGLVGLSARVSFSCSFWMHGPLHTPTSNYSETSKGKKMDWFPLVEKQRKWRMSPFECLNPINSKRKLPSLT